MGGGPCSVRSAPGLSVSGVVSQLVCQPAPESPVLWERQISELGLADTSDFAVLVSLGVDSP